MLLDGSGYRKFTPQECALLNFGADALLEHLKVSDPMMDTGVRPFDSMEPDEQLVALHTLCLRAGSDHEPAERQLWLEATLMAVLVALEWQVEISFDLVKDTPHPPAHTRLQLLSERILASYRSFHWHEEEVLHIAPDDRTDLEVSLLEMGGQNSAAIAPCEKLLIDILAEYQTAWFYDLDFQISDALDLPADAYAQHLRLLGIAKGYHLESAPSCPPQDVRAAREFFDALAAEIEAAEREWK